MIELGKRNVFLNAELWLEDSENHVHFGDRNRILGKTHIAVIEGTSVIFGDECLFSTDVIFRTGDSHSIYEAGTNKRINPSRSIEVGNRVWFGNKTIILKGVSIADDCIVATGAVVTKPVQSNTVVGGNPAKVLKQNVQWGIERTTV